MKNMVVDAKTFSDAMNKVSRVLKKSCIPILEEVCVRVRDGVCTLTATDLENWLAVALPVEGDDMTFAFSKTRDVMKACAHFDGELTIELYEQPEKKDQRKLRLYCGRRTAEYDATSGEDYPVLVTVENDKVFQANAARLLERIERVRYAALKPDHRTTPTNTCVQFKGQRIYSLDGYRLACDTLEGVSVPMPFLAYGSALAHLKVFGKSDVTVQIGVRYVKFTDGETSLIVRRQGVETYDVEAALPKEYRETVTVKTVDFLKELSYLKECAAGFTKPYVCFAGDQLTMSAPGRKFRTSIPVSGREDLILGFDLRYMLDALKQFKDEPKVTVKLSGVYSPIVIEAEGRSDFALILPVRLKAEELAA